MSIWETLGEILGRAFKSVTDTIMGMLKFKPEQLEDVNKEISGASLDPSKFRTKEVNELAQAIKDKLKSSPTGPADWVQSIMGDFMSKIWDVAISIMIPSKMETFEEAKASATWISNLFADFIVLSAVLDMVGTALSATLVRNLIHIFRLFAATFGLDRYMDACIAPALTTSIVPRLTQGYNAQYQTLIPGVGDLIRMAVREAFTPEIAEKFGQYEDYPEAITPWLEKQGLSAFWSKAHWAAHWDLPSVMLGYEMLHRGIITEDELKMLMRALDIMPFWRPKLIETSWAVPNRIEIRMMTRYLDMPKEQVMELLGKAGLHPDYRSDAADFMMIMGLSGYWSSMLSGGWMTPDNVKADIDKRGFRPETAERIYKSLVKANQGVRTTAEKELTKAEIIKGVKKNVITWDEGVERLADMNYSSDEAELVLAINLAAAAGSPETPADDLDLTQKWRKAVGLEAKPVSEELKKASAEVVRLTKEVEALTAAIAAEEEKLVQMEPLPEAATAKRDELRLSLHRAEAELERAKVEYNRQLAQWRHSR